MIETKYWIAACAAKNGSFGTRLVVFGVPTGPIIAAKEWEMARKFVIAQGFDVLLALTPTDEAILETL